MKLHIFPIIKKAEKNMKECALKFAVHRHFFRGHGKNTCSIPQNTPEVKAMAKAFFDIPHTS